jgi:hypothetical protein
MYLGPSSFDADDPDEPDPLLVYYRNVHQHHHEHDNHHQPGQRRSSGTGILEFSTAKAGQDVTPARFDFQANTANQPKKRSGTMHSLAGALSSVTNLAFSAAHHASGSATSPTRSAQDRPTRAVLEISKPTESLHRMGLPRQASLGAQLGTHVAARCMTGTEAPRVESVNRPASTEPIIHRTTFDSTASFSLLRKLEQGQTACQNRLDSIDRMVRAMLMDRAGDSNALHQIAVQLAPPSAPLLPVNHRHFPKKIKHSCSATFATPGRTAARVYPPLRNTQSLSEHYHAMECGGGVANGDVSAGQTVGSSACSIETSDIDLDDFEELSGSFNFREFDILFEESHPVLDSDARSYSHNTPL